MSQYGFDKFSYYTNCAVKSMNRLKTMGMLSCGLSASHTICMRHLHSHPDGLTRTDLVKLCDIDKAQISRIINELCSKGYVIETEDEGISYRKCLKLTPLGKDTTEEINKKITRVNEFVSGGIPKEQMDAFYKTLELICEKLILAQSELAEELL